jgi:hypothetical protein
LHSSGGRLRDGGCERSQVTVRCYDLGESAFGVCGPGYPAGAALHLWRGGRTRAVLEVGGSSVGGRSAITITALSWPQWPGVLGGAGTPGNCELSTTMLRRAGR